jgi:hypothetical protein
MCGDTLIRRNKVKAGRAGPSTVRWLVLVHTTIDGHTDKSKRTEFVCPSSTHPLSAGSFWYHV